MPTTLYLQNGGAGYSGYDVARAERGGGVTTATVNTVSGGTDIQWTKTAGGSALSFASKPLAKAITISGSITVNIWASESNGLANAGVRLKVFRLQPSGTKTLIATLSRGVELTTSLAAQNFSGTPTSTAFSVGDRVVLEPYITNVGTMGAGRTCDMTYNGGSAAASGDSYVTLIENLSFTQEFVVS